VVFNFIGVSLAVPARVRYRYMLDGYDRDWSQPTESREAAYTNLPPARYTFRVMASNSEGLWNGAAASVPFEVEPQLSETWWFRVTGLCAAAAAIFAGFRYRVARAHAAMNQRLEERLGERTRIARELHDTLLQSFQGLMLRLQVVDDLLPPGKAKEQLEQSLERADQAIAEGRRAVHDLRSSTVASNDLAEALRAAANEFPATDARPSAWKWRAPRATCIRFCAMKSFASLARDCATHSNMRGRGRLKGRLRTAGGFSG
jgi:signal transduction histidine kinase